MLSNRTELKIPYTPSLRWYMMVLGVEPVSSAGRGGIGGGAQAACEGVGQRWAQQEDSRASPSSAMGRLLPPPVFMAGLETPCS